MLSYIKKFLLSYIIIAFSIINAGEPPRAISSGTSPLSVGTSGNTSLITLPAQTQPRGAGPQIPQSQDFIILNGKRFERGSGVYNSFFATQLFNELQSSQQYFPSQPLPVVPHGPLLSQPIPMTIVPVPPHGTSVPLSLYHGMSTPPPAQYPAQYFQPPVPQTPLDPTAPEFVPTSPAAYVTAATTQTVTTREIGTNTENSSARNPNHRNSQQSQPVSRHTRRHQQSHHEPRRFTILQRPPASVAASQDQSHNTSSQVQTLPKQLQSLSADFPPLPTHANSVSSLESSLPNSTTSSTKPTEHTPAVICPAPTQPTQQPASIVTSEAQQVDVTKICFMTDADDTPPAITPTDTTNTTHTTTQSATPTLYAQAASATPQPKHQPQSRAATTPSASKKTQVSSNTPQQKERATKPLSTPTITQFTSSQSTEVGQNKKNHKNTPPQGASASHATSDSSTLKSENSTTEIEPNIQLPTAVLSLATNSVATSPIPRSSSATPPSSPLKPSTPITTAASNTFTPVDNGTNNANKEPDDEFTTPPSSPKPDKKDAPAQPTEQPYAPISAPLTKTKQQPQNGNQQSKTNKQKQKEKEKEETDLLAAAMQTAKNAPKKSRADIIEEVKTFAEKKVGHIIGPKLKNAAEPFSTSPEIYCITFAPGEVEEEKAYKDYLTRIVSCISSTYNGQGKEVAKLKPLQDYLLQASASLETSETTKSKKKKKKKTKSDTTEAKVDVEPTEPATAACAASAAVYEAPTPTLIKHSVANCAGKIMQLNDKQRRGNEIVQALGNPEQYQQYLLSFPTTQEENDYKQNLATILTNSTGSLGSPAHLSELQTYISSREKQEEKRAPSLLTTAVSFLKSSASSLKATAASALATVSFKPSQNPLYVATLASKDVQTFLSQHQCATPDNPFAVMKLCLNRPADDNNAACFLSILDALDFPNLAYIDKSAKHFKKYPSVQLALDNIRNYLVLYNAATPLVENPSQQTYGEFYTTALKVGMPYNMTRIRDISSYFVHPVAGPAAAHTGIRHNFFPVEKAKNLNIIRVAREYVGKQKENPTYFLSPILHDTLLQVFEAHFSAKELQLSLPKESPFTTSLSQRDMTDALLILHSIENAKIDKNRDAIHTLFQELHGQIADLCKQPANDEKNKKNKVLLQQMHSTLEFFIQKHTKADVDAETYENMINGIIGNTRLRPYDSNIILLSCLPDICTKLSEEERIQLYEKTFGKISPKKTILDTSISFLKRMPLHQLPILLEEEKIEAQDVLNIIRTHIKDDLDSEIETLLKIISAWNNTDDGKKGILEKELKPFLNSFSDNAKSYCIFCHPKHAKAFDIKPNIK